MLVAARVLFDRANAELVEPILHANPENELDRVREDEAKMVRVSKVELRIVRGNKTFGQRAI